MSHPTFIHVPVFDSTSPDKPKMVWVNPHHFMYLEDREHYTAAHTYGEGAYHILLPFRELMLLINPDWHG